MLPDITNDRGKVEKFIMRYTDDVVRSTRSAYFRFAGYIIRVSDHIGTNSSGAFSIIPVGNGNFVVHKHSNGMLKLQDYDEIKEFIKHAAEYSDFLTVSTQPNWDLAKNEMVSNNNKVDEEYILGIPKDVFTPGQLRSVEAIVAQVKSKNNIDNGNEQ